MPILESICPVCGDTANNSVNQGVAADINCQSCGNFRITWEAASDFPLPFQEDLQKAIARHFIRKLQGSQRPTIELEFLRALSERRLPAPPELCDNLLMYLAEQLDQQPGKQVAFRFDDPMVMAIIGAVSPSDLAWAVDTLRSQGLSYVSGSDVMGGNLTAQGWERVDLLRRARIASRYAFFARKFDNPDLDTVFKQCLSQAVADTGFELRIVTQRAGLIDAIMEDEIRRCRFLLADLSDYNAGAYWEAGFAEGLGKPVIYICSSKIEDTHFDTNHRGAVRWDLSSLDETAKRLKAVIRNTLLGDAIQED